MSQQFDVFLSHASEDKTFVESLANELASRGVKVWYDRFILQPGDSLSAKIDQGLRDSNYGIIVLSPHFFSKPWPESEYRAMLARQNSTGTRCIIPVWHNITRDDVAAQSPLLLDIFAIDSKNGVVNAALQIMSVSCPNLMNRAVAVTVTEVPMQSRYEEYDFAPYKIGAPGVPSDAVPWQPYFAANQPCLDVCFGEPNVVDPGCGNRRWGIECLVTNVGSGAARELRLFFPGVAILSAQSVQRDRTERISTLVDDRLAFWNHVKPPLQTVFEYEDAAGVLYRQYGTMHQMLSPSGAYYRFTLSELGKPFRVKERIVANATPKTWFIEIPR